jgi:uncharacterized protein (TIGR02996 family)
MDPHLTFLEMVERVRKHPEDAEARLVVADRLTELGNPQGELMLFTHQLSKAEADGNVEARSKTFSKAIQKLQQKCKHLEKMIRTECQQTWLLADIAFQHGYVDNVGIMRSDCWAHVPNMLACRWQLVTKIHACVAATIPWEQFPALFLSCPFLTTLDFSPVAESPGDTSFRGLIALKNLKQVDCFQSIKTLRIRGAELKSRGLNYLKDVPSLSGLDTLDLYHNEIGISGAETLASIPQLHSLTFLSLNQNLVSDEGTRALMHLHPLKKLFLAGNNIGDQGAITIAESPSTESLIYLELSYNALGDRAAKALANSPYLGGLTYLNLFANQISDVGKKALRESPYLRKDCGLYV